MVVIDVANPRASRAHLMRQDRKKRRYRGLIRTGASPGLHAFIGHKDTMTTTTNNGNDENTFAHLFK